MIDVSDDRNVANVSSFHRGKQLTQKNTRPPMAAARHPASI
jgi:hypothetical protein